MKRSKLQIIIRDQLTIINREACMLSAKMLKTINTQIKNEMYSANLYLQMAAYCTLKGMNGMSHWLTVQYHEEMFHAMKFYTYVNNQGGLVELQKIDAPPAQFGTPLEMFKQVLEHEKKVTKNINDLADIADAEKDRASQVLLNWYIMEQVEEEKNDNEIITALELIKSDINALMAYDTQLGTRILGVPSDYSAAASTVQLENVSA
jgi:ferritin